MILDSAFIFLLFQGFFKSIIIDIKNLFLKQNWLNVPENDVYSQLLSHKVVNTVCLRFEGKDKYNLCKHLGDADFCGQVKYLKSYT